MSLPALIIAVSAGLIAAMSLAWVIQRATANAGWVDVVWTFATGGAGVAYALVPTEGYEPGLRSLLTALLVAIWSLRLGLHLALRTAAAEHEDARYAGFRRDWGSRFEPMLFGFLMIQALAAMGLTLSVLVAARNPAPALSPLDGLGAALLAIAIGGEAIADAQLARFKADPKNRGRICEIGLWAWSRHPNYFFEWLGWLAYPILAYDPEGGWPWGWLALTGPAFMFYLLRFASGVPATEEAMAASRGEAFERYRARVSAFFPRPPRGRAAS